MSGRRNTRCDAKPLEPASSEWAREKLQVELASSVLCDQIMRFGLAPQSVQPKPALTFEQQLARVMAGAPLVTVRPARTAANQRIDGSVLL